MTKTFRTVNPATEETLEELSFHTEAEVEGALADAKSAFQKWRRTALSERSGVMRRTAQLLREDKEQLARHCVREMGKPYAQAEAEILKCARTCDWFAEHAPALLADRPAPSDTHESYVAFDPLGTVLAIMPWNFPYWQVFRAAAPALMAGNGMLLKHALSVSRCALAIEELFVRAGTPRGLFRTLLVPHEAVPAIVRDDRVVAATLTGSERAGASIAREAGGVIKKTVLELGGSDPFIVLADADIDAAVDIAVTARFQNAGQSCIAAKRFIVEAPVAEAFTKRFVEKVRALRTGDPMDASTDIGPLARADLRDELDRLVRATIDAGARAVVGGAPLPGRGYFYAPTVLVDVPAGAPALTDELFGPVAPIRVVRNADEAVARANDSRFGLGGNLWTRDIALAKRLVREIESGAVFVNGMTASDARLPFGGVKKSGYGRELAEYGLHEFVNVKTVWIGPKKGDGPREAGVE
jgi:succinate-semialdehyde dehydrogenase/glutarate-semialdehyde dehydrogenase